MKSTLRKKKSLGRKTNRRFGKPTLTQAKMGTFARTLRSLPYGPPYPVYQTRSLLGQQGLRYGSGSRDTRSLALLAGVALTRALGDDDTLHARGCLAPVAAHQILPAHVTLVADGSTAVVLAAVVARGVGAAAI